MKFDVEGLKKHPAGLHLKDFKMPSLRGVSDGDWISLATPRASLPVRVHLTEIVPPGVVNFYHA